MDDATALTKDETITEILKESKLSVDRLHEAKPYRDISIKSNASETNPKAPTGNSKNAENVPSESNKSSKSKVGIVANIETVFEKLNIASEKEGSIADSTDSGREKDAVKNLQEDKSKITVPSLNVEIKDNLLEEDDIFSATTMNSKREAGNLYSVQGSPSGRISRQRDSNTNVFPVGCMGCKEGNPLDVKPSPRRFLDANEASTNMTGHIDNTPRKKSSKQEIGRNPLTGTGTEPIESRRQMIKRKDGNPVLGTGYDEPEFTPSTNRIPPGGYSKGLW